MSFDLILVNPPMPRVIEPGSQQPLGLLYLVSSMKLRGWSVKYLDMSYYRNAMDAVADLPDARLYGFTSTFVDYNMVKSMSESLIKDGKKTILGGSFITTMSDSIQRDLFTSILIGEADYTLNDVLMDLESNNLKKVYYGKIIMDLDSLPFPARDELNKQGGNIFINGLRYDNGNTTNIITSRGCIYNCAFCGSKAVWGNNIRFRSIANIVDEIKECVNRYNITNFRFADDNLNQDAMRLRRLCKSLVDFMKSHKVRIHWRASVRVTPSSIDQWLDMKKAGCEEIIFGIESFDDRVLSMINKQTTALQNEKAIKDAQKAGLKTRLSIMINAPGEKSDTADINIRYLDRLKFGAVSFKTFVPTPGSDVWCNPERYEIVLNKETPYSELAFMEWFRDCNGRILRKGFSQTHRIIGLSREEMLENRNKMIQYIDEHNLIAESGIAT